MLAETLGREGYRVEAVATGDEAVRRLAEGRRYALVLTDLKLPGADGIAVLEAAVASDPALPVLLMTGYGTVETAVVAMKKGAADFLGKPVDPDLLLMMVARHVEARRASVARTLLAEEAGLAGVPRIDGSSPALAEALEKVRRAAPTDVTVLLTGESGVGDGEGALRPGPHPSLDGTLDETVERWSRAGEAARVRRALEASGGDRSRAAADLGIPLRRLAKLLGTPGT